MKSRMIALALLALSVGCGNAVALLAIEGTVVIDPPPATLLRGQTATITYTVTNTGDEPLEVLVAGTEYYERGPLSTVLVSPTPATAPCLVGVFDASPRPGEPLYVVNTNSFLPRPVLPGESRQCVMDLMVSPEAAAPFVKHFGFLASRGATSITSSQVVTFNLGEEAIAIPTLRWLGVVFLTLLVGLAGARVARR